MTWEKPHQIHTAVLGFGQPIEATTQRLKAGSIMSRLVDREPSLGRPIAPVAREFPRRRRAAATRKVWS